MSTQIKFELEFPIQASPQMLFQYFATPSGLSEWFADNVNSRGVIYTFIWDGSEEKAKVLQERTNEKIKFTWLEEDNEKIYFEFKIQVDELTNDVSLIITDFAEEEEVEESKMFWENQIEELKHTIGA
ncbi:MAG: START-like domain-containing protein [Lutibacter sp.]|jgi:uncharacterized protein YndB with AHSA1/START domain|uniref:START-like domain-containing protein n=1 Tax=Lutibacter sp. TaxID=1925666 RepID=UPI00299DEA1E|nr:START-like domain-containing protein [Lutibacter sp.]MDX1827907.1 START-like domain-containing protein [Lutibacter sp.]